MLPIIYQILFVISKPDVYKSSEQTYVIFGEAKIEDLNASAQAKAAQNFKAPAGEPAVKSVDAPAAVAGDAVDESGINPSDIELVMSQAEGSTRAQAVKALRNNKLDPVDAIMELTM
jgi:nascent polypeptide-associated complex subunit alpha